MLSTHSVCYIRMIRLSCLAMLGSLMLLLPPGTQAQGDLCPFKLSLWNAGTGCIVGSPDDVVDIIPDVQCRSESGSAEGPGTYRASCSGDGTRVLFSMSGCTDPECGDLMFPLDRAVTTKCTAPAAGETPQTIWAALTSGHLINACRTIRNSAGFPLISYFLEGNCTDFSCDNGNTPSPTISPYPTEAPDPAPTSSPTRAPQDSVMAVPPSPNTDPLPPTPTIAEATPAPVPVTASPLPLTTPPLTPPPTPVTSSAIEAVAIGRSLLLGTVGFVVLLAAYLP